MRSAAPLSWIFGLLLVPAFAAAAADGGVADPAAQLITRLGLEEGPIAARDLPGWHAPRRIVVYVPEDADEAAVLAPFVEVADGAELVAVRDVAALPEHLAGADVLLGLCTPQTVAAGTSLRWIQHYYVGVERCVGAPGLRERGILLTNGKQLAGPPIAEHVIGTMLALARGLPRFQAAQQRGEWRQELADGMWEMEGKTMLVVGLGGIGTEVAARAHALGMRVVATRNSRREGPPYIARVGLPEELHALAAEADVVVNCAPLTPATTGIFNRDFFRAGKRGAYFINIGRGQSAVTDDLVAALQAGELGGAALDVVDPEPLPAGHPLWQMPNVIITPHVAAGSDLMEQRLLVLGRENLRRYVAGERLLNVVDLDKGY